MTPSVGDSWAVGAAYEGYMGRWSRALARAFLEWLGPKPGGHWLEIGCGTGALTGSVCAWCEPSSVLASDPSAALIEHAKSSVVDSRVSFVTAGADALPSRDGGFDAVVSGLVLNFIPEPERALRAMRERVRPGGLVGAYVWDYAGGVEFLQAFWEEATALDANAIALDEAHRFSVWQAPLLVSLFEGAGLVKVEAGALEIPTHFEDFADYWHPFLGGTGPAPSYAMSLEEDRRQALCTRLMQRLVPRGEAPIRLRARATAVCGRVA